jgi:hypothetical protein
LIAIGLIGISSVFTLNNEANSTVDIDALVDKIDYRLKLYYASQELNENSHFAIYSKQWLATNGQLTIL